MCEFDIYLCIYILWVDIKSKFSNKITSKLKWNKSVKKSFLLDILTRNVWFLNVCCCRLFIFEEFIHTKYIHTTHTFWYTFRYNLEKSQYKISISVMLSNCFRFAYYASLIYFKWNVYCMPLPTYHRNTHKKYNLF